MFAARFVTPSIVSKNSRTDAQLVAKKVKQSRWGLSERQRPSRKSHQADLCGEAQLIAMATLREDQVQVFATQRGVADQVALSHESFLLVCTYHLAGAGFNKVNGLAKQSRRGREP